MFKKTSLGPPPKTPGLRRATLAILFVTAASWGAASFAQHPGHGRHQGGPGMGLFAGRPEHVGRMVDHWLEGTDATEAQRTKIKQIAQAAATDLKAQADAGRGMRVKGLQLFTAPTVDAAAVEALRQQHVAQHDAASRRVTQAMLDISQVLTPEQRVKLGQRLQQRAEKMRGGGGGGGRGPGPAPRDATPAP